MRPARGPALWRAVLAVSILGSITTQAVAQGASASECATTLLIRDRLDLSGKAEKPATLTMQHSAGSDTFGVANIALMGDRYCASSRIDHRFSYGVGYYRNSNDDTPSERAGVGLAYQARWMGTGIEPSKALDDAYQDTVYSLSLSAEQGRDIEQDLETGRASVWFNAFPVGVRSKSRNGKWIRKTGWLGGRIQHVNPTGPLQVDEVLFYEFSPGIEYYSGYQSADFPNPRHVTYGAMAATATWTPFTGEAAHRVYLSSSLTMRGKIAGDKALPGNANTLAMALGYRLTEKDTSFGKHAASVELAFEKGRDPEQGFARNETFYLRFTYLLDRITNN